MGALVVARDGHVNVLGGRVHVGKGNHGDVSVTSLSDGLMVGPGVSDQDQAGLAESGLDLIGECTLIRREEIRTKLNEQSYINPK